MAEPGGGEGQQERPRYNQEIVQYQNNKLALRLRGADGALFDFTKHKYSPTEINGEGIISTKSGNDYYIYTKDDRTYIIEGWS